MRVIPVSELMTTNVVSVRDDASLTNLDWEMTLAEIRHVPVVDERGVVVGIVSDRDLLRSIARSDRREVPISVAMTQTPVTVRSDAPAVDALTVMLERKVSAVPVVDDRGTLVGIVTASDFLDLTYRALRGLPIDGPRIEA